MSTFLQPSFWFTLKPTLVTSGFGRVFVVLFLIAIIAALALRLVASSRREDRLLRPHLLRGARMLTTMGVIGMVLAFLSFEDISFLGARFWYPVWAIVFIVWAIVIVVSALRKIPVMRAQYAERSAKNKYMPGR